ncbi:MAG: UDP-3-O-acyl-N-acetylglucosamine deacetylase, partial [Chlamydiota bacterium]|nr:UDP-3-O-acyl-N-acetylglucosamine deacetylase [Chlamydiota bacterium]
GVPKSYFQLKEPIWYEENGASIVALPYPELKISYVLSYKDTKLKDQYMSLVIDQETFKREIAPARTFCFYNEVEYLMEQGLIKGGSLDNAVVVGKDAIFSKEKLRYADECVRHKILDVMGDIYLLGHSLKANLIAVKTGHSMNFQMTKRLYEIKEAAANSGQCETVKV